MGHYKLINNYDGNETHDLDADNYVAALEEALEELGWWLSYDDEE